MVPWEAAVRQRIRISNRNTIYSNAILGMGKLAMRTKDCALNVVRALMSHM
jgi:hypothetical protein